MKIFYGSDVHLEFAGPIPDVPKGDLLLLAGDIFTPWKMDDEDKVKATQFFRECSNNFGEVIYTLGNHEHYGGFLYETDELVKTFLSPFKNIRVLNNESVIYDNFSLFASTFWTDCKNSDPEVMWHIQRNMNDYGEISTSRDVVYGKSVKLRCPDTVAENFYSRKLLVEFLSRCNDYLKHPLIMTHHNPSMFCVPHKYKLDDLSYGYSNTGLDDLLLDEREFTWVCGHTHEEFDEPFGNGRIIRNCRGYVGYELAATLFQFKELFL